MNAEIAGEIPHIAGGQSPDTEIPTSGHSTSPPFPRSQRGAARPLGRCCGPPLLVPER